MCARRCPNRRRNGGAAHDERGLSVGARHGRPGRCSRHGFLRDVEAEAPRPAHWRHQPELPDGDVESPIVAADHQVLRDVRFPVVRDPHRERRLHRLGCGECRKRHGRRGQRRQRTRSLHAGLSCTRIRRRPSSFRRVPLPCCSRPARTGRSAARWGAAAFPGGRACLAPTAGPPRTRQRRGHGRDDQDIAQRTRHGGFVQYRSSTSTICARMACMSPGRKPTCTSVTRPSGSTTTRWACARQSVGAPNGRSTSRCGHAAW